jgi:PelA/Pel-15E family pectate lyase
MLNESPRRRLACSVCLFLGMSALPVTLVATPAATAATTQRAAQPAAAGALAIGKLVNLRDDWFKSLENLKIVDNVCSWQNANGGWWKAYDVSTPRPEKLPEAKGAGPPGDTTDAWHRTSTIDNGATYSEMRLLARAHRVTGDRKYADAFNRGLKFLFDAQYANGGWPQRYPIEQNYGHHITYNDDAMVGVLRLLRDVTDRKPDFALVSDADRQHARQSFDKGVDCILSTQVKVGGKLTAWCQQHDAQTLAPAKARAYELPSLCSAESASIVSLLMSIDKPDDRMKRSIEAAVAWFEASKITGKRVERLSGAQYEGGKEVRLVDDRNARPIWARFYDLDTGKPFVCDRDGIKKDSFDQISHERRVGYAWYNDRPAKVIEEFAKWKARAGA